MDKQPTIFDVAKLANVAPSTVSRYLNSSSYVANETKKKVEMAVKKLQYRPSRFAKNLRAQSM
ncbi:MAG: LacI family DNA-binding transcriptional regulator, partial [Caldisericum sp.]|uniref:LacI family DNA-binding transcriptional regulator n=1 Tax=Caldisericum sp. TaxID=2499687 RepID=UPI003D1401EC